MFECPLLLQSGVLPIGAHIGASNPTDTAISVFNVIDNLPPPPPK